VFNILTIFTEVFPENHNAPRYVIFSVLMLLTPSHQSVWVYPRAVPWAHCYTADLPAATFAEDTAVVATDSDPSIASQKLQTNPDATQKWLKRWRIRAN
jgi:hypothetical protein